MNLLAISLREKDYDLTASTLTTLRDKFQFTINDLTTLPEYAGFVASPQYKKWKDAAKVGKSTAKVEAEHPIP